MKEEIDWLGLTGWKPITHYSVIWKEMFSFQWRRRQTIHSINHSFIHQKKLNFSFCSFSNHCFHWLMDELKEYYNSNCYIGTSYRGDTLSNSQFDEMNKSLICEWNQLTLRWVSSGWWGQYNCLRSIIPFFFFSFFSSEWEERRKRRRNEEPGGTKRMYWMKWKHSRGGAEGAIQSLSIKQRN